jgi:uncharacterized protein YjbJ (UPF0337 family)
MTQQTSGLPPAAPAAGRIPTSGTPDDGSTTEVARDQAGQLGASTADAGRHVVGTAKEQVGQVTDQARREAKDLLRQARGQVTEQARGGQQKVTGTLRALAAELHEMTGGENRGPASDLAAQAASRVDDLAGWLDQREPADLLEDLRSFARRRPGAFLAGAAIAGVLAGRLTRGAVDARRDTDSGPQYTGGQYAGGQYPSPAPRPAAGYPAVPPSPMPYDELGGVPATAPRPYTPDVVPPGPGTVPYTPGDQVPPRPGGPAHALDEQTTVGEYVQDQGYDPDNRR